MTLADQIIEHGPYEAGALVPNAVMRWVESEQLNALRDELIAARALRELLATGRYLVYAPPYRSGGKTVLGIQHDGCRSGWWDEVGDFTALGELVRRAAEHGEVCR